MAEEGFKRRLAATECRKAIASHVKQVGTGERSEGFHCEI
jgi:hypothetical protein